MREIEERTMSEDKDFVLEGTLHSADGVGVVRLKTRYRASIDDVWSALTEPLHLAGWFGTVAGDLRVGGEFTAVVMSSGWDGQGRIEECDQLQKLRVNMW